MGLKIRHNGNITHITGNEYEPGNLGTKRLKIRAGGQVSEYGLTTDPNATSYCGLQFMIHSSKHYIGRRFTSVVTGNATRQGQSTRPGWATRQSEYETGSYAYTYTYTTATSSNSIVGYKYSWYITPGTVSAQFTITRTSRKATSGWSGQYWIQNDRQSFWSREYASTNGVQIGGTAGSFTAWWSAPNTSPSYVKALSSTVLSTTGAWQNETGSFVGNRTSIRWRNVTKQSNSTSREYTSALTSVAYATVNSYWGIHTYTAADTITMTHTQANTRTTGYFSNTTTYQRGTSSIVLSGSSGNLGTMRSKVDWVTLNFVESVYSMVTGEKTLTSDQYVSRSWVTYKTTRQSDYSYQSNYTYQSNYVTSSERATHNFV